MRFRTRLARVVIGIVLLASARVEGQVVERTVAFVNRKPVLLSDVRLAQALLAVDEKDATERAIEEHLMVEEASRLLSQSPAEDKVAAAIETLREKAGPGFPQAALRRKALAELTIAEYIDLRLRPLVRVDDADVRRAFSEKADGDPSAPPFESVESGIRESLERRALDRRIEEWVTSIKRRATIRRP